MANCWTTLGDDGGGETGRERAELEVDLACELVGRTAACICKDASLLIASGADVKVVQKRLRHASAMTTLNTYGHMWPDADESARAAVAVVLAERADSLSKIPNLAD